MPLKRRGFVKGLLVTPVIPLVAQQPPAPPQSPSPHNDTPDIQRPRQFGQANSLATVPTDTSAEGRRLFFSEAQFSALERLGEILSPPMQGKPGAREAGASLFLDFLISESPKDRQHLYRHGLDGLNSAAGKHFDKPFADLDATQASKILKPLLAPRFWSEEMPEDPMQHFVAQAHDDLRKATMNSREYATASSENTGGRRRGFNQAIGLYWSPIDPVVRD